MIKTILVEDEKPASKYLQSLLEKYTPELDIVGVAENAETALMMINSLKPQLVFLDIELPDYNGFILLEKCKPIQFEVIFTTAFSQYAIKAFEYFALGYIIKPVEVEQLLNTVKIATERLKQQNMQVQIEYMLQMVQSQSQPQSIPLPTQTGFELVKVNDIVYCKAEGNYTIFYFQDKSNIVVSKQLGIYEKMLSPKDFIRIHNKYIINIAFVSKYIKGTGGTVIMRTGDELSVSANRKNDFLERFMI